MKHYFRPVGVILSLTIASTFLLTACNGSTDTAVATDQETTLTAVAITGSEKDATVSNLLDSLKITIPEGMDRRRISETQEYILKNTDVVGGISLLECDNAIFDDVLGYTDSLRTLVLKVMENVGISEMEWYMDNSSMYGIHEFNMGNDQSEYIAYVVRGQSSCYVLWFDRKQVSYDEEIQMMQSLHSDDISESLNKISSEDFMNSIAEMMDKGEYQFEVTLPNGFIQKEIADDGALFYKDKYLIGGYKVIHFEKGILPSVHDNKELILNRLKEYLMEQIDLTDYSGEITDESLITAVFRNGDKEYSHYILSYGQVGTQYDIWLDTALLDSETVNSIVLGAQLKKVQ